MSRNRGKDTSPEILLRKALWHRGVRYRKNYSKLNGTPDIVLLRRRIAIFVDGDFWHARYHQEHPGEQIQGFPDDWTKESLVDGKLVEMPVNKRRFMMGNALVVNLVRQMERQLSKIFEEE